MLIPLQSHNFWLSNYVQENGQQKHWKNPKTPKPQNPNWTIRFGYEKDKL